MKIAIPTWNGRVSPVMDTARQLTIVEQPEGSEPSRTVVEIPAMGPPRLAGFLSNLRIDVLICGAISRELEQMLIASGIRSHPWCRGEVDKVIAAHSGGFLDKEDFQSPGCRRRRRGRGRCRRDQTDRGANKD